VRERVGAAQHPVHGVGGVLREFVLAIADPGDIVIGVVGELADAPGQDLLATRPADLDECLGRRGTDGRVQLRAYEQLFLHAVPGELKR